MGKIDDDMEKRARATRAGANGADAGRHTIAIRAALANILQALAATDRLQAELREQRRQEAEQTVNILREMSAALRANTEATQNLTRAYGAVCVRLDLALTIARKGAAALNEDAILAELDALADLPRIALDERGPHIS